MKMAKASKSDLEMAAELANALEAITGRWHCVMPEKIAKPEDGEETETFDRDDSEQCRRVVEYLCELADRASLFRVVAGMFVVLDPRNKLLDPDADTLEVHPDFERTKQQRDELLSALERLSFAALCRDNTMGDQCRLIEVRAELAEANRHATAVMAKVKGQQPL